MPFDFHNRDRMESRIDELKDLRYRCLREIGEFTWHSDGGEIGRREPGETESPGKVGKGFTWSGWDRYNWLCTTVEVGEELIQSAGEGDIVGLFDFGAKEGTGNNSHFESLLYVNGEPYQGVDGNHKEVFFPIEETGRTLDLKFRVWSGLCGGGRPRDMHMRIMQARIGILDRAADDLFYLARTALDTYDLLPKENEYKEWLLGRLVRAFALVDYTSPGDKAFYESVKQAYDFLSKELQGAGKPDVTVTMLGHTHIDVAWLWRIRHTREKAARSFSTVNRLMEKYPSYRFLQSQAQLYEFIKTDYPDVYEHIRDRVAQGRWEPSGSMWVECDCNLTSGESIIRQILVGKQFFKKEFGYDNTFLWLPDVFGYSWALPQILKKSGIDTFMTTKISWNDTNQLPYDTFLWKGMDGSLLTTHFITTTDQGSSYYTYNGGARPYAVKGVWDNYRNKDLNRDLLISFGYGDGGGGPNRDMIKTIECVEKMPGIPHVKWESATDYFDRLGKTLKENPLGGYLPVWDGELYLEFHRGTYTSQAYNKKTNRQLEYRLRRAEILGVLAGEAAGRRDLYDRDRLLRAWKIVLCQQFHDILPGSSIHEVYEDSHEEYRKAAQLIEEAESAAAEALLTPDADTYTVWNGSNWTLGGAVKLPGSLERGGYTYLDEAGQRLPAVCGKEADYVWIAQAKPFGAEMIKVCGRESASGTEAPETFGAQDCADSWARCSTAAVVDTPYYHGEWNASGQLTQLYDKTAGRNVLAPGKSGNILQIFEDKPRCFDAWELEPTIDEKCMPVEDCRKLTVERNELGTFVHTEHVWHDSHIRQTVCFYERKRRIDFVTHVDWREHQKLLKAAFPVDIRAVSARYDIQEGNIVRPIVCNSSWDAARFETVAHKWVDFSETGYGIALLNNCKYGHDIKDNTIRLSLLKSAVDPDYDADNGQHEFTYSLLPHEEEWYAAGLEQEAFSLNEPLTAFPGRWRGSTESAIRLNQDFVEVDAVKRAENGDELVLRFHEYTGRRGKVKLELAWKPAAWCECNLMEEPCTPWQDGAVEVEVTPYEIKTLLFQM